MKKRLYIKNIFALLLLSAFAVSCSEDAMDKVNEYGANPRSVQLQFMLPDLLTSSAFTTTGGDFSTYASIYVEHEGGVHNQTYNAELRLAEPSSVSTYNNTWNGTYTSIMIAKEMILKATSGAEEGSKVQEGIARLMLAYNAAVMTDLFGDIPYFESGVLNEKGVPVHLQPKVDKQEIIYKDIFEQIDKAIGLIATKDVGPIGLRGACDYVYGGSTDSWIKAAYALKARYTMRLINKSASQQDSLRSVLRYVDKAFTSAAGEVKFNLYNGGTQVNPLAAYTYSRQGLGASQSFVTKLTERQDPRLTQMFAQYVAKTDVFTPVSDPAKLVLVPNGSQTGIKQSQGFYSNNITDIASSAPTLMMSYHELLFLKAEAHARLGELPEAEAALKAAITAGFANLAVSIEGADITNLPVNFDLSAAVSAAYYTNNVKALFDANPLKEIMVQKYLAMNGANGESVEMYSDIRRMKGANEDFITLANPLNTTQFPYRFVYGSSDNASNVNVSVLVTDGGRYVYTEKVWWAGGTR